MSKNHLRRIAPAFVFGFVIGITGISLAGEARFVPVQIVGSGRDLGNGGLDIWVSGTMRDTRFAGATADYIGCSVTVPAQWIECHAIQKLDPAQVGGPVKHVTCGQTASPTWITAISGVNSNSLLRWQQGTGDKCAQILVDHSSWWL